MAARDVLASLRCGCEFVLGLVIAVFNMTGGEHALRAKPLIPRPSGLTVGKFM